MATQKTNILRSLKSFLFNGFFILLIIIVIFNLGFTIQSPSKSLFALVSPTTIAVTDINVASSNIDEINEANQKESEYLWAIRGQIGDLLAGHFTVLAVIGLLFTILQMRKSLKKQDELLESQEAVYQKQSFENTFFQLLTVYQNQLNGIEIEVIDLYGVNKEAKIKNIVRGKKAIDELFNQFQYQVKEEKITHKILIKAYKDLMGRHHSDLQSYFRTLYRVLKFIDEYDDKYDQIDKIFYTNLLRGQLSFDEVFFIFINGLTEDGHKFKILIEKYSLLEHLTVIKWFNKFDIEIIEKYDIKAFGEGSFSKKENQKKAFLGQREMKIK